MDNENIAKMMDFEAKQRITGRIFDFEVINDKVWIKRYHDNPNRENVIIPDFVSFLDFRLFYDCRYIKEIHFGSNISKSLRNLLSYLVCDELTLDIDTSNITDMRGLFVNSRIGSINFGDNFNTSKVTDMNNMFAGSRIHKLDLSKFDTSSVRTMEAMFDECNVDELNLGDKFITNNVEVMSNMFNLSKINKLDLGDNFDTSNTKFLKHMFYGCKIDDLRLGDKFKLQDNCRFDAMFAESNFGKLDFGKSFKLGVNDYITGTFYKASINGENLLDSNILKERGIIQ